MPTDLKCKQVCELLSYYIKGKTNYQLTNFIEHHLKVCKSCRNKYEILKKAFESLYEAKTQIDSIKNNNYSYKYAIKRIFEENMSSYIDHELSDKDSIKFKKYVIANPKIREELESMYKVKNYINTSFKKTKKAMKEDYSKDIIMQLDMQKAMSIQEPVLKVASIFIFIFVFLSIWAIILF